MKAQLKEQRGKRAGDEHVIILFEWPRNPNSSFWDLDSSAQVYLTAPW